MQPKSTAPITPINTPDTSTDTGTQNPGPVAPTQPLDYSTMSPQDLTKRVLSFRQANQQQGISDVDTLNWLKAKGITPSTGGLFQYQQPGTAPATTITPNSGFPGSQFGGSGDLGNSLVNTLKGGASAVSNDVTNTPQTGNVGTQTLEDLSTAGHVAGDIAGTAGGAIGDVIAPFLPDSVKSGLGNASQYITQKVSSIPGMTPEIQKGLGDVFNTLSLEGGVKAEEAAPAIGQAAANATDKITQGAANLGEEVKNVGVTPQDTFNKQVVDASKVINPKGIITPDDIDKMSDVDKSGMANSITQGKGIFAHDVMRPEVLANDPHNELVRELMDKGVVSPENRQVQNLAGVKGELQNEGKNLTTFLKDPANNVDVNYKDLTKNVEDAYNKFKEDNSLRKGSPELQKARSVVQKYLDEVKKINTSPETSATTKADMVKKAIENFNNRMKNELGDSIYDGTPEGKAQVKMAKLVRKSGYDTIQNALNEQGVTGTGGDAFKNSVQRQAELYDLIDEMKSRTNSTTVRSWYQNLLNSNKGYALRRLASRFGQGAAAGAALNEVINR